MIWIALVTWSVLMIMFTITLVKASKNIKELGQEVGLIEMKLTQTTNHLHEWMEIAADSKKKMEDLATLTLEHQAFIDSVKKLRQHIEDAKTERMKQLATIRTREVR